MRRSLLPCGKLGISAVGIIALAGVARGQSTLDNDPDSAPGFTNSVFHTPSIDSINLYNGGLTIPIPVGPSYPIGPKLKLQLQLTYTSHGPDYSRGGLTPGVGLLAGDPALGLGWNFTLGAIKTTASSFPLTQATTYMAPDGSQHVMSPVGNGYYKSLDATSYYLHDMSASGFEMWDGEGNRYVFGRQVTGHDDAFNNFVHDLGRGRDGWYLTSLYDPFGNGFTVTYQSGAGPCWVYPYCAPPDPPQMAGGIKCSATAPSWIPSTITLTSGATINVDVDTALGAAGLIRSFRFPVFANGTSTTATWNLVHAPASQNSYTACSQTITSSTYKLTDIQPPAISISEAYHFDYSTCPWLLLTRIKLPTTGTIDYAWGGYTFYHGRPGLSACNPTGPPAAATILVSTQPVVCGGGGTAQFPVPGGDCNSGPGYLDDGTAGVVTRTQTDPVSGVAGTTTYTQYSFPFGERGVYAPGVYNAQTLTVVVFPPDQNGKVRSKSLLFYSGPNGSLASPGDRVGADLREADYDFAIPRYEPVSQPACATYDYLFCANHAIRVTNRAFDYDMSTGRPSSRHLMSEKTYFGQTAADGTCSTCSYHGVDFSNSPGRNWDRNPFDSDASTGNGRHYNVETHSGNLGSDFRQIITTWTPLTSPWLPNLKSIRTESDGSSTANQYFDYKLVNDGTPPNGFLRGTLSWDPGRRKVLGNCRYPDAQGNVSRDLTLTIDWPTGASDPQPQQCTLSWPTFPALASGGGIFGSHYTYSNGQRTTARWINGSSDATWLKYDVTRDARTGWITSSRDTAGAQTSYVYDSLGRPTAITPAGEVATTVTYDSTRQTTATRNGGADSSTWSQFQYDGFGRTIREIRQMPGSGVYAKKFTKFDPRGNAYFQSEWVTGSDSSGEGLTLDVPANCSFSGSTYATNVPSSARGTYRACFDPYGRAQLLTGAGYSGQTTVSRTDSRQSTPAYYSDTVEAVTVACVNGAFASTTPHCSGGSDAITTTTKDAFGRSTTVVEPSGDTTTYGYDVLGKPKSVSQGAQSGSFARTFDYDLLGLLRQERTPEKGIVTYGSVGPLGNVLQQTEPGGLFVNRVFDYATRLTSVSTNEGRTYVTNTYDEPGRGSSAGKLTTSVSTNWALPASSTVTDAFSYLGVGGRLSGKTETLGGSASLTTTQSFNYNSLGLLSSHSHPRKSGDGAFTVSYSFNAGLPVTELVNGAAVVSGIGYGPSGALASYTTNNGAGHSVTTTVLPDGSLPRPSRILTSGASNNFDSGVYFYDGAGNIRIAGADTFGYDIRSRLVSANVHEDSGTNHPEAFTYDRFGNILTRTADGSGYTFTIDPNTNRLVAGAQTQYDPRGNLTLYGASNYAYDGLSRQTSYKVTGSVDERYLYDAAGERKARVVPGTTTVSGAYLYNLTPCRVVDTRGGGGPVYGQTIRTFAANNCGIPANATALAANVTSTNVTSWGYFRVFPAGAALPTATTNAMRPGQSRATQAFVSINGPSPGSFSVFGDYPAGYTADFILDVSGYFAPQITSTPDSYNLTFRDPQDRLATKYSLAGGVSAILKDYVYVGNQLVATWQPSSGYSFFVTDHLGTPRLQTDTNATTVTKAKTRAFGLALMGTLPEGPEFAAMEKDSTSGNHYDHARFYGAWLGRFHSPDQLGGHAADPQSWNRYAYARNNPLKYVDPDGRQVASTQSTGQFLMAAGTQAMTSANRQTGFRLVGTVLGGMGLTKLGDLLTMGTGTGTAVESGRNLGEALSADISRGITIGSILGGIASALRSVAEGSITEISVSSNRFGEAAAHIEEAQAAGQPSILTIDRAGASARRADAMRGVARVPGLDRDEYPPAMFKEGGEGASVRTINPSNNRACGAFIGNQCSGLSNGQTVRIVPSD